MIESPQSGQPLGPVLVPGLQRAFDQQPPEAGAVDEQVGLQRPAVLEHHMIDEAVFGLQDDVDDLALDPGHAPALADLAQVFAVKHRVEMIGRVQAVVGRSGIAGPRPGLAAPRGMGADRIGFQTARPPLLASG